MRLYSFHNWYLGGNQGVIQTQHSSTRLFVKYQPTLEEDPMVDILYDWATNHETTIILNGGDRHNLACVYELISGINKFPFAAFIEDGVGDSITNISLVLPTDMCDIVDMVRNKDPDLVNVQIDEKVFELLNIIGKSRLMQ